MPIVYKVDKENMTVTATLSGTENDARNQISKQIGGEQNLSFGYTEDFDCKIPNQFEATVKCSPHDSFDEEIGKRLAKRRCMRKYYNSKDYAIETWYGVAFSRMNRVWEVINSNSYKQEDYKIDEAFRRIVGVLEERHKDTFDNRFNAVMSIVSRYF